MHLSYLPLAHIFETVVMGMVLLIGGAVGFYQGAFTRLDPHSRTIIGLVICRNNSYPTTKPNPHNARKPNPGDTLKIIDDLATRRSY